MNFALRYFRNEQKKSQSCYQLSLRVHGGQVRYQMFGKGQTECLFLKMEKKKLESHRSYRPFAFTLNSQKDSGADNETTCKNTMEIKKTENRKHGYIEQI